VDLPFDAVVRRYGDLQAPATGAPVELCQASDDVTSFVVGE